MPSRILVLDEVVDPDDVRVFDLGESEGFGGGGGHRVGVAGMHQTLEHHPAVVHVAVDRQVDPAEAAVGDAAAHFVLPADEIAARKLGNKRVTVCRTACRSPPDVRAVRRRPRPTGWLHSELPQNR